MRILGRQSPSNLRPVLLPVLTACLFYALFFGPSAASQANMPTPGQEAVSHEGDLRAESSRDSILIDSGRTFDFTGRYRLLGTGEFVDLSSFRGKTILIDFWTTWCRPCIVEIPEANEFADRIAGRDDVVFVSVNQDEVTGGADAESIAAMVEAKGIAYPVLLDSRQESLKHRLGVRAWPTKIMIDRDGSILRPRSGRLTFTLAAEYLRTR